ncbi:hypothetical protein C475_19308 [Halosimplex carlsbadense 2-9-1]|uniref:DUF63 domain-containing protein n=1 Tax=Halosimplex carlsbadense 2-9-1 TaxID=797114 RepID=M0CES0_9EURY|nr:DUF63 family protein [Halosimplex carlsbadense]ELZ21138.1 hypothetical protein C475_19308 [Halosimplex carlsbadense 2-9-1]
MKAIVAFVLLGFIFISLTLAVKARQIAITKQLIVALVPWFGIVGATYALEEAISWPKWLTLLIQTPMAYVTVSVVVLTIWIVLDAFGTDRLPTATASLGTLILFAVGVAVILAVAPNQTGVLRWNAISVVLAFVLTGVVSIVLYKIEKESVGGWLGATVVFSHVLDAMTTVIGLEVLGATERNPISAAVINAGNANINEVPGVIMFLFIKITVAVLIVRFAADTDSQPDIETLGLLVVAGGVGLAPAVHNLVLFSLVF